MAVRSCNVIGAFSDAIAERPPQAVMALVADSRDVQKLERATQTRIVWSATDVPQETGMTAGSGSMARGPLSGPPSSPQPYRSTYASSTRRPSHLIELENAGGSDPRALAGKSMEYDCAPDSALGRPQPRF
jgi:hypothetical protein